MVLSETIPACWLGGSFVYSFTVKRRTGVVKPITPATTSRAVSMVSRIARANEEGTCWLRGALLHHPAFPAPRCSPGTVTKIVNSYHAANLFILLAPSASG